VNNGLSKRCTNDNLEIVHACWEKRTNNAYLLLNRKFKGLYKVYTTFDALLCSGFYVLLGENLIRESGSICFVLF
jgi:hypothetical protein